jgi:hypothetical protein
MCQVSLYGPTATAGVLDLSSKTSVTVTSSPAPSLEKVSVFQTACGSGRFMKGVALALKVPL